MTSRDGGRTVVVVDDEPLNCELVEHVLLSHEVADRVVQVVDPQEALAAIEQESPGCVLLDLMMPDVDGMEVLRRIRELHGPADLPVIIMTASSERSACHSALQAGASDFLTKPMDLLELALKVRTHLDATATRRELDRLIRLRSQQVIQLDLVLNAIDIMVWIVDAETGERVTANEQASDREGQRIWELVSERLELDIARPRLEQQRLVVEGADGEDAYDLLLQDIEVDGDHLVLVAAYEATGQHRAMQMLEDALSREQEALDGLREVDDMRARFLTATSHELRTPLTVIIGALAVASQQHHGDALGRLLSAGSRQANHLHQLLTDLVTVAEGSVGALDLTEVPLRSLISAVVATTEGASRVRIDVMPAVINVDPERFRRAVAMVIDNALRFSPPAEPVTIRTRVDGEHLVLSVTDAGPGIDEASRERVFEPFVRGKARVDHSPGTGIGLTVARIVARAHGGDLTLEDGPDGRGTTARMALPVMLMDQAGAEAPSAREETADR